MVKAKTVEDFEGFVCVTGIDWPDGTRTEPGEPAPAEQLIDHRALIRSGKVVKDDN